MGLQMSPPTRYLKIMEPNLASSSAPLTLYVTKFKKLKLMEIRLTSVITDHYRLATFQSISVTDSLFFSTTMDGSATEA